MSPRWRRRLDAVLNAILWIGVFGGFAVILTLVRHHHFGGAP